MPIDDATSTDRPSVHQVDAADVSPYDAVLLVSFGGPEKAEDVVPFLENVTRGRGIPRERLEEVGAHYHLFGGRSPINDQNRAFIEAVRADLDAAGIHLPIYWGNRNWDPYLTDTVAAMAADGITRAACFVTSAYSSWSGCRQYRENLYDAVDGVELVTRAPALDKLRHYFNHPGFVEPSVDAVLQALADLPEDRRAGAHLAFVTHSIPTTMNDTSGPPESGGGAYVAQHEDLAATVVEHVRAETGIVHPHEVVFCSRSGPPQMPWLKPDINDHLEMVADRGAPAVVMVPIGFVSDHMEVLWDLDTEAKDTCAELGLAFNRVGTPGTHEKFVRGIVDLVSERLAGPDGSALLEGRESEVGLGPWFDVCRPNCCSKVMRDGTIKPTIAAVDSEVGVLAS